MSLNIALILAFILPCIAGLENTGNVESDIMARVAGGADVRNRYLASIQFRVKPNLLEHFCGASFINDLYVVTAAHCVKNMKKWKIRVVAGVNKLAQAEKDRDIFHVKRIIVHENYTKINGETPDSDIALLQLQERVTFKNNMRAVALPQRFAPHDDKPTLVVGWGKLGEDEEFLPERMQRATLRTVPHDECIAKYDGVGLPITENMLCAAFGEAGPCHMDEGGPLMLRGTLVGITSWYHGCATNDYPGVFAQVGRFVDWINSEVFP